MRVILWCTGLKYKRGSTVRKMQMASRRSPQILREKIRTWGGSTLRPPAWCVRWQCLFTARGGVSMDSGFCVTVVIVHLHEHSVYGKSLIKKRNYWPHWLTVIWRVSHSDLLKHWGRICGGGYLSTYTAPEMTGLLPNWWLPTEYSKKCLIIPPTGKIWGVGDVQERQLSIPSQSQQALGGWCE